MKVQHAIRTSHVRPSTETMRLRQNLLAEKSGRWMGVAHNVGDALTYKILTDDTKKIIFRSAVRPREDKDPHNHLGIFGGVEADKPIK